MQTVALVSNTKLGNTKLGKKKGVWLSGCKRDIIA